MSRDGAVFRNELCAWVDFGLSDFFAVKRLRLVAGLGMVLVLP
jgi:hypothetical protein